MEKIFRGLWKMGNPLTLTGSLLLALLLNLLFGPLPFAQNAFYISVLFTAILVFLCGLLMLLLYFFVETFRRMPYENKSL